MDLPRYYIVGRRPVKVIETEDGGMAIYALSWKTGEFVLDMWYSAELDKAGNDDVEDVSDGEFTRKVEELRKKVQEKKAIEKK